MASTPEGKVKDACKKFLKSRGAWFFMPVSNGMGQVGIPDIICSYRGIFVAIETKAPGKKLQTTANQNRVIEAIRESGGYAFVVDNAEDLRAILTSIDIYFKLEIPHGQIDPAQT